MWRLVLPNRSALLIGLAADAGGSELKEFLATALVMADQCVVDFDDVLLTSVGSDPNSVVPMARAVASGEIFRGIAICRSGVGASIATSSVPGVRSALITDPFSAHQGVEDDDMNLICLGSSVTTPAVAWDLVRIFLEASFRREERLTLRLEAFIELENQEIHR